jgi:phenylpropionate dioxygenase-like ring-hydroxylating dioxygenase large terminal subunit
MLSPEENELVSRVGPGTPMGEVMRRYWLPALLSEELPEPDGAPVRVKLLCENLIAFRDTTGRVGLIDEVCPHRGASLWLGRNEDCGLRCIYHGWKFDVDGNCIDQMNEPDSFAHKIKATAYPTFEQGGIVWTYMGVPERQPPPPNFEFTRVPEHARSVSKVWQECNWMQALEGGIDSSHAPILHRALPTSQGRTGIAPTSPFVRSSAPVLEVDVTDYGYMYAAVRMLDDAEQYIRGYHFVMPFTQLRPTQTGNYGNDEERPIVSGHHWVPMDDHNCMVWNWHYSFDEQELEEEHRTMDTSGNGPSHVNKANEYRAYGNRDNNWLMDRERQKTVNFSGIDGINAQDRAVQESMGYIVDRSREHLGPADKAIIAARRLLLQAVRTVQDGGVPPGAGDSYYNIRAIEKVLPRDMPWREGVLPEMYPNQAPPVPV